MKTTRSPAEPLGSRFVPCAFLPPASALREAAFSCGRGFSSPAAHSEHKVLSCCYMVESHPLMLPSSQILQTSLHFGCSVGNHV